MIEAIADHELGEILIRTAVREDWKYVIDRAHQFRKRFNFVPMQGLLDCIERKSVFVAELNGQRCGYILTTGGIRTPITVRHNAVEQELWRNKLGRLWMSTAARYAKALGQLPGVKKQPCMITRTRADRADQIVVNAITGGRLQGCDPAGKSGHVVTIWHHDLRTVPEFIEAEASPGIILAKTSIIQPETKVCGSTNLTRSADLLPETSREPSAMLLPS